MSTLVFTPDRNVKRADYSSVFLPAARHFLAHHSVRASALHQLPLLADGQARPGAMLEVIRAARSVDVVALFCHGFANRIQLGFRLRTVRSLANALAEVANPGLRVILYACSSGMSPGETSRVDGPGGDGGFADALRDALCVAGIPDCQVDAHTTSGHAVANPFVRRFRGEGSPVGGQGGSWIVQPRKAPLWGAWRSALKWPGATFAFDFPFMSVGEIHAQLMSVA